MPKFVGRDIEGVARTEDMAHLDVPQGYCVVVYSQAKKLNPCDLLKSLDTRDRGSRGSFAKRWWRWLGRVEAVKALGTASALRRAHARVTNEDDAIYTRVLNDSGCVNVPYLLSAYSGINVEYVVMVGGFGPYPTYTRVNANIMPGYSVDDIDVATVDCGQAFARRPCRIFVHKLKS
jgi:hypothetical protein